MCRVSLPGSYDRDRTLSGISRALCMSGVLYQDACGAPCAYGATHAPAAAEARWWVEVENKSYAMAHILSGLIEWVGGEPQTSLHLVPNPQNQPERCHRLPF